MDNREKIDFITKWISDYILKISSKDIDEASKCNSLVVGISGGIDSSLTSTLCALTGLKTFGVRLPIVSGNPPNSIKHCNWLSDKFKNVEICEIDLTNAFESFSKVVKKKSFNSNLGFANSKSRLRMITLYQIAASTNSLVVGTGNKVEDFGVGFFTKYGDGGVDISPIADLTKTEVRELAKELKIINEVINAEPTDGLWDDARTDKDQLGLSYEELEEAMTNEGSKHRDRYLKIREKSLHKMNPIPVCIIDKQKK
ncbi:MAG: NAD(+) synthase [Pseudomonadota bacterium]|nr:NAD(+) synthase [Pseudomonadota bacterium]